jgi:hypothetical protein
VKPAAQWMNGCQRVKHKERKSRAFGKEMQLGGVITACIDHRLIGDNYQVSSLFWSLVVVESKVPILMSSPSRCAIDCIKVSWKN